MKALETRPPTFAPNATSQRAALMAQVVDLKLTRTELLDLIVKSVSDELDEQERAISAEINSITFTAADILPYLRKNRNARIDIDNPYRDDDPNCVRINMRERNVPLDELSTKVRARYERKRALEQQNTEISNKRVMLKNGKYNARLQMIRESLDATPEGKRVLEAIEALKEHVRDNILLPQLPERAP